MTAPPHPPKPQPPASRGLPVLRNLFRKPRLLIAMGAGLTVFVLCELFAPIRTATAVLAGWNTTTLLYLGLAWAIIFGECSHETMRQRAEMHDDGENIILLLSVVAAVLSLVAILFELAGGKERGLFSTILHFGLSGLTLMTSWAFIHTAFAFHYAHGYYAPGRHKTPCLIFPGTDQPQYTDFLYFSFVIGTSGQTADVSFAATGVRRIGLVHCIISYLFNATVLALMINISASMI